MKKVNMHGNKFSKKNEYLQNPYFLELLAQVNPNYDATLLISSVIEKCGYNSHPTTRHEKRSVFASIANALFLLKGVKYTARFAHLIDNASGNWFGKGAKANVLDLYSTFIYPPGFTPPVEEKKTRTAKCTSGQSTELELFLFDHILDSETEHILLDDVYEKYTSTTIRPVSRYTFTKLLKKREYKTGTVRVGKDVHRCLLHVSFAPHTPGAWMQIHLLNHYFYTMFLLRIIVTLNNHTHRYTKKHERMIRIYTTLIIMIHITVNCAPLARAPPS